jgi:hypothetical protein
LVAMSETFKDRWRKMADTMKDFCDYFAEKLSWPNKADLEFKKIPKLIEVLGFFVRINELLKLTVILKTSWFNLSI